MRKFRTQLVVASIVAVCALPALAWAQSDPVEVRILDGSINPAGTVATVDFEVENYTDVTARLVALIVEYDTASGTTVTIESQAGLDLRIPAGELVSHTAEFATVFTQGEFFDWRNPYTVDAAIGADIAAVDGLVEEAGENPDRIIRALETVSRLSPFVRRSRNHFTEDVESLPDWSAWFDWETIGAFQPDLEQALCTHLGRRVRRARGAESRVETYRDVAGTLGDFNLYPDCIDREDRMAAARALVATDRANDALVLTERDEAGEVLDDWRDIYIAGRLALAAMAIDGTHMTQFRPGLQSLDELVRLDPENRQLGEVADRLLNRVSIHVVELIGENMELDALEAVQLMRVNFSEHTAVQTASVASLNSLVSLVERSLRQDRHIRANNAYVRGLATFADMEEWQGVADRIQQRRSRYFLRIARNGVGEATEYSLTEAEEALEEAEELFTVDPEVRREIVDGILLARWAHIDAAVDDARYEDAMAKAQDLVDSAENPEVLGELRAQTYMRIAEEIWDRYGMLAGIASRNRLGLAEEALELGESANPELASSLSTKFFIARWLFPALILLIVVVVGAVILFRGSWRRRRKARRMWNRGLKLADDDELRQASELMERAYDLVSLSDDAAIILDEENRGYVLLRLARVLQKRGRKDKVEPLRGEWKLLEEWEQPFSKDFDEALDEFGG